MAGFATAVEVLPAGESLLERKQRRKSSHAGRVLILLAVLCGLAYIGLHIARDFANIPVVRVWPFVLLGVALLIALGFEFVNGFHDTANAVAPVIYTNSLPPNVAVVWSGLCNLLGVLVSSGAVAFAVVALLPVELILRISSGSGFAMVFALLIAAILWNLGTWWLGLPASSSHTMVGSIIGVGLANQLLNPRAGASGLDWPQVVRVLEALLISPLLGFFLAGLLLLLAKRLHASPCLNRAPRGTEPPPFSIRALMVLTCSGVSFFHGSNDGQKGMGLIMLILIGTVPTAYALNHALGPGQVQQFIVASAQAGRILDRHMGPPPIADPDAQTEVAHYLRTGHLRPASVFAARQLVAELQQELVVYGSFQSIPAPDQTRVRNEMVLTGEALQRIALSHDVSFTPQETAALRNYRNQLDKSTRFIPDWVKVAVALALGLGTMVGWKRIVVTVGERIGKEDMTYAQGASAGLVTMATIFAADKFGLPVSTTHILSSGVAGAMSANGSGLRLSTVRNIAAGWVLTLPAAALLSGILYVLLRQFGA